MKYYFYLLPLLLIFYGACEKPKISARAGIIGEAETWFTNHHSEETEMATIDGKMITIKKRPAWDRAISKTGKQGNTCIIVPLKYDGPMGVGNRGQTNLVIEKMPDGEFTALVAKGIGTKTYLRHTGGSIREKDFTGVALFYDWEENFKFGYQYRKGKVGGHIRGADENAVSNPLAANGMSTGVPWQSFANNYNLGSTNAGMRNAMPNLYDNFRNSTGNGISNIVSPVALRQQICFTLISTFYQQVTIGNTTYPPQVLRTDVEYVCWDSQLVEEIDWIAPEPGGTAYIDTTTQVDLTTQWQWPPNPVDGQVATYVNFYGETVSFTYNSQLGGWMAKTMVVTINRPSITVNITNRPPEFGGGILLAMSGPALAEPTPVGEIVVAGTAVVLGVIWLVRMADYLIEETVAIEEIRRQCTDLYYDCYMKYGFTKPCSTCQQYCISQNGDWDDLNCPLP